MSVLKYKFYFCGVGEEFRITTTFILKSGFAEPEVFAKCTWTSRIALGESNTKHF